MTTIQIREETSAICQNKKCENYQVWELVDVDEIIESKDRKIGYVLCPYCKEKIIIE